MNKQGIELTEEGHRTTGIRQFFDELPDHIRPMQKAVPPYMPYTKGHGYLGVLLVDTEKDRVQCHLCGRWYKSLGAHLKIHKETATSYKKEVGLFKREPLMSYKTVALFRRKNSNKSKGNLTNGTRFRSGFRNGNGDGSKTMQFKNRYGTCDAQLGFRLSEAVKKYGRVPFSDEEATLANVLGRRYGSWSKGLEAYGYTSHSVSRTSYDPENDLKNAPACKICGVAIMRKRMPSGDWEDRNKWLNKKTCSVEHLEQYLLIKYPKQNCIHPECPNKYAAKGYCNSHYLQFIKKDRKHGYEKTTQ